MRRDTFLSQFCASYPAAPGDCRSLSRWQMGPSRGWIGGILSWSSQAAAEGGDLLLLSGDQKLHIRWDLPYLVAKNIEETGQPLAHASISEVLRPGDLVAVYAENTEEPLRVSRMIVLAPQQLERPPVTAAVRDWAGFLHQVRDYFISRGLHEVTTPHLVSCPGLEPSLEPIRADHSYLPTSPEIHLKKALSLGFTDIFEIKTCFRKNEVSPHRQPEFQMLEWYRAFADLQSIRADLKGLLPNF